MQEGEVSTVARTTRVVSARELSRRMAQLLDEMESEEMALIVLRYGRPAAMFVPFEENGGAPKLPRLAELGDLAVEAEEDEPVDDMRLDPMQVKILADMATCTDHFWRVDRMSREMSSAPQRSAVLSAVTRLELADLVDREWHVGLNLTRKGRRVAARLDSEA